MRFDPDFRPQPAPQLRLAIALAIATVFHAILILCLRIDRLGLGTHEVPVAPEIELLVLEPEADPELADVPDEETDQSENLTAPDPVIADQPDQSQPDKTDAVDVSRPAVNWQSLAEQAARKLVAEDAEREAHNADLWRRTHSVMFAPRPVNSAGDEAYLLDLVFDDRIWKGFGFKIGENCFIGIPASPPKDVDSDANGPSTAGSFQSGFTLIQCGFE